MDKRLLPLTECLKDTFERILPYWCDYIVPSIRSGLKVFVCAHGSTVRSLIKHLDQIPDDEIVEFNVPTGFLAQKTSQIISFISLSGIPLVYELDENLHPIRHYYVAPDDIVKKAIDKVANQGKASK